VPHYYQVIAVSADDAAPASPVSRVVIIDADGAATKVLTLRPGELLVLEVRRAPRRDGTPPRTTPGGSDQGPSWSLYNRPEAG
jgi:hypothetical protein